MPDKDLGDGPSLELPKLFGRKGKGRRNPPQALEPAPEAVEPVETSATEPADLDEISQQETAAEPVETVETVVAEPAEFDLHSGQGTASEPAPPAGDPDAPPAGAARPRRVRPALPTLSRGAAAVAVGVLVGLLAIGLTVLGLLGCEALDGGACGGGSTMLVLLVVALAATLAGAGLLAALGVEDSLGLSVLGVGFLAVVELLFFIDVLDTALGLAGVPVMGAIGFGAGHWVTARSAEPDPELRR